MQSRFLENHFSTKFSLFQGSLCSRDELSAILASATAAHAATACVRGHISVVFIAAGICTDSQGYLFTPISYSGFSALDDFNFTSAPDCFNYTIQSNAACALGADRIAKFSLTAPAPKKLNFFTSELSATGPVGAGTWVINESTSVALFPYSDLAQR